MLRSFLMCVVLGAGFVALALGEDPPAMPVSGTADARLAPLDALMVGFLRDYGIPGGALAIARGGRLLYARGFGFADVAAKKVVQPDARFRIASVSKPITAACVMRLVERGKLGLDDAVFLRLAPALGLLDEQIGDERLREITVRQLLQHRGGFDRQASFDPMFRSASIAEEMGHAPPAEPIDIIRSMWRRPLDFAPGKRYAYSNFGYCVLGRLIEQVTGHDYEAAVREEVLAPLGLTSMRIGHSLEAQRCYGEVRYYAPADHRGKAVVGAEIGAAVPWQYGGWYLEAMDAHGGWIASAPDLVRFASALDARSKLPLLSAASLAAMFARPDGAAGSDARGKPLPTWYGCGWCVRPIVNARVNAWHTGSLDGTSTLLVRRHDGFVWAALFNSRDGKDGADPAGAIDPLIHRAVDQVREWPAGTA